MLKTPEDFHILYCDLVKAIALEFKKHGIKISILGSTRETKFFDLSKSPSCPIVTLAVQKPDEPEQPIATEPISPDEIAEMMNKEPAPQLIKRPGPVDSEGKYRSNLGETRRVADGICKCGQPREGGRFVCDDCWNSAPFHTKHNFEEAILAGHQPDPLAIGNLLRHASDRKPEPERKCFHLTLSEKPAGTHTCPNCNKQVRVTHTLETLP